jgi:uncharacterized membrane protein
MAATTVAAAHCGSGRIADGFIYAIDSCGAVLATHFPRTAETRDDAKSI